MTTKTKPAAMRQRTRISATITAADSLVGFHALVLALGSETAALEYALAAAVRIQHAYWEGRPFVALAPMQANSIADRMRPLEGTHAYGETAEGAARSLAAQFAAKAVQA